MSECLCLLPNGQIFRHNIPDGAHMYNFGFPKRTPFLVSEEDGYELLHERITLQEITLRGFLVTGLDRAFVPIGMRPEQGWTEIFRALYFSVSNNLPRRYEDAHE